MGNKTLTNLDFEVRDAQNRLLNLRGGGHSDFRSVVCAATDLILYEYMVQLEKVEAPSTKAGPETSPEAMPEASEAPAPYGVETTKAPEAPAETPIETPAEAPAEAPAPAPAPAPKRRVAPRLNPSQNPSPKSAVDPRRSRLGEPEDGTYTPEPPTPRPTPIVTHQDFMRYIHCHAFPDLEAVAERAFAQPCPILSTRHK